jgi:serine/tyrosine/threonine adenylyltransferase
VLRSTIREYLCGEAMHYLGIPSTRALCIIGSQQPVYRETVETAALLIRVAESHIRFGSFEYFFHTKQPAALKQLADHVIDHHYPALRATGAACYANLFREIVQRTATLIAQWQAVGFAHGVMNTDNMSILGLTLDYGPFGFLDEFDPDFICNHSDHSGRYAFVQQPTMGLWNLNCLAYAFSDLVPRDELRAALEMYEPALVAKYQSLLQQKFGLSENESESLPQDQQLIYDALELMQNNHVDYTIFFRRLCDFSVSDTNSAIRDLFIDRDAFDAWAVRYSARLQQDSRTQAECVNAMKQINPKFILRNHLAQIAIEKAQAGDFSEIENLLTVLTRPFDEHPAFAHYADLPPNWSKTLSISCSS